MTERTATILRVTSSDQGTEGVLLCDTGWHCRVMELPWRDNQQSISCIPAGEYLVQVRVSPRYGTIYWITDVEGRSWILIHGGNVAGDTKKGYKSHSNGCLLLGRRSGELWGQRAVLVSKPTVNRFMREMGNEPFKLTILEAA